jgi:exopolysaccharide biosynthesis polyprenyl glycosylphosphotransferase
VAIQERARAGGRRPAGERQGASASGASWVRRYRRRLTVTDFVVIVASLIGSQVFWFGADPSRWRVSITPSSQLSGLELNYMLISGVVVAGWLLLLHLSGSRSSRVVGIGIGEYTAIVDASFRLFGLLAIVIFLLKIDLSRGYVLTAFPAGLILLVLGRWAWRQWLVRRRRTGDMSSRTLVVGMPDDAAPVVAQFTQRHPHAGYQIIGICVPSPHGVDLAAPDVLGTTDRIDAVVAEHGIDVVILSSGRGMTPAAIKDISWKLETSDVEIAVSPSLLDVVGPRVHSRSIAGMPLIHIDLPRYEGTRAWTKGAFDRLGAALAVIVLSPVLLAIAIAVAVSSPGPVLFRQRRVGRDGREFDVLKFRSMVQDAEQRLAGLQSRNESEGGVLFKIRHDPRVTRLGAVLRRHSLDELPQFFNVLKGDMSLVGPRPPLPSEVEKYESHVLRRFLVKPGLTGPWQISGRSDLSWEDAVRLDLFYVENWSLTGDLIYLWRTIKVVFGGRGAY